MVRRSERSEPIELVNVTLTDRYPNATSDALSGPRLLIREEQFPYSKCSQQHLANTGFALRTAEELADVHSTRCRTTAILVVMGERRPDVMTAHEAARLLGVQPHDDARVIKAAFEARDQDVRMRLTEATAPLQQAKYREIRERLAAAYGILTTTNAARSAGGSYEPSAQAAETPSSGAPQAMSSRTFRQKLNHYGAIFFGLIAVLAVIVRIADCASTSPEEKAIHAATQLVAKQLRSPSTASYPKRKIVAEGKDGWFMVHVIVDAENAFGATVRGSYLVTVKVSDGDDFEYHEGTAVLEASTDVSQQEISTMKELNDWK